MLRRDVAVSVRRFVSGIWQIHPFREGNTRTVMTLVVLYLRTFGFRVGAESFAHSRFLRDALVLANARHAFFIKRLARILFVDVSPVGLDRWIVC